MLIRETKLKDVPEIVEMWENLEIYHDNLLRDKSALLYIFSRKDNSKDIYKKFLIKQIKSKNSNSFVAEHNNEILGYCLVNIEKHPKIHKIEKVGIVSDLFVKKEFRGKGVSSGLKNKAIDWFKSKGIEFISLKVFPNNNAHSIYSKWGFDDYQIEMRKKI